MKKALRHEEPDHHDSHHRNAERDDDGSVRGLCQLHGEYRIGAGDTLDFQLFDDTQMSREVKVRYDGYISLPQIEEMKVAGMTRAEALDSLNKAYLAVYKKPHIALTVKEAASKAFFLLGDVEKPGEYPYVRPLTVLEALNTAGGPLDMLGLLAAGAYRETEITARF